VDLRPDGIGGRDRQAKHLLGETSHRTSSLTLPRERL